jgi:hypothetical protein
MNPQASNEYSLKKLTVPLTIPLDKFTEDYKLIYDFFGIGDVVIAAPYVGSKYVVPVTHVKAANSAIKCGNFTENCEVDVEQFEIQPSKGKLDEKLSELCKHVGLSIVEIFYNDASYFVPDDADIRKFICEIKRGVLPPIRLPRSEVKFKNYYQDRPSVLIENLAKLFKVKFEPTRQGVWVTMGPEGSDDVYSHFYCNRDSTYYSSS